MTRPEHGAERDELAETDMAHADLLGALDASQHDRFAAAADRRASREDRDASGEDRTASAVDRRAAGGDRDQAEVDAHAARPTGRRRPVEAE